MAETREGATRIFTGYLRRTRQGQRCSFTDQAPEPVEETRPRPAKIAITLALAHRIEAAIERGEYRDRADVARQLGISRARVTQITDLTLLAPDIQERVLQSTTGLAESRLTRTVQELDWHEQRNHWRDSGWVPPQLRAGEGGQLPTTSLATQYGRRGSRAET